VDLVSFDKVREARQDQRALELHDCPILGSALRRLNESDRSLKRLGIATTTSDLTSNLPAPAIFEFARRLNPRPNPPQLGPKSSPARYHWRMIEEGKSHDRQL
jgi:hypothetical protein